MGWKLKNRVGRAREKIYTFFSLASVLRVSLVEYACRYEVYVLSGEGIEYWV